MTFRPGSLTFPTVFAFELMNKVRSHDGLPAGFTFRKPRGTVGAHSVGGQIRPSHRPVARSAPGIGLVTILAENLIRPFGSVVPSRDHFAAQRTELRVGMTGRADQLPPHLDERATRTRHAAQGAFRRVAVAVRAEHLGSVRAAMFVVLAVDRFSAQIARLARRTRDSR